MLLGILPWQNLKAKGEEDRYKKIYEKKATIKASELCAGLHNNFVKYVEYTKKIQFTDEPDYSYLRNLFFEILSGERYSYDFNYEWLTQTKQETVKTSGNDEDDNKAQYIVL